MSDRKAFQKFLILWFGELISSIGSGLSSFGLGIYVFQKTGLAMSTALITLLAFLPTLLFTPLAGVLADRHDRRILMIIGEGFSALGLFYILRCMRNGGADLRQIGIGVAFSSVFVSLIEPSYKATVSDLLSPEDYTKASGMVQLAASSKYLVSPALAGFLMKRLPLQWLLIFDIGTILITVFTISIVRKSIINSEIPRKKSLWKDFREGWKELQKNKGVLALTITAVVMTFALGFFQTLSTPMLLAFTDSEKLGIILSLSAVGMLFSALALGIFPIRRTHLRKLSFSLIFAGGCMAGFGAGTKVILLCIFGFLFFAMLPIANANIDYLVRTNINNEVQGRVWGLIGILSQSGYIAAYAVSGILADRVFTPMFMKGGLLFDSVGAIIGKGEGRGSGFLIVLAGFLLCITALVLPKVESVSALEKK